MNNEIKKTLQEMLDYIDNPDKKITALESSEKKLSKVILYAILRDIVHWNHPFFIKINEHDPDRMELKPEGKDDNYKNNVIVFFENYPKITALYEIKGDYLVFKEGIEKDEIRSFIEKNKKIKIQSKETRMR